MQDEKNASRLTPMNQISEMDQTDEINQINQTNQRDQMNQIDQKRYWYVIQTKANQEEKVIFYLNQRGIRAYLPKKKNRPIFPGYIFVLCTRDEIYAARWISGVKRVLIGNKNISPIYDISFLPSSPKRSQPQFKERLTSKP